MAWTHYADMDVGHGSTMTIPISGIVTGDKYLLVCDGTDSYPTNVLKITMAKYETTNYVFMDILLTVFNGYTFIAPDISIAGFTIDNSIDTTYGTRVQLYHWE